MRRFTVLFLVVVVTLLAPAGAWAQQSAGRIMGTAMAESGQPLPGVDITVDGAEGLNALTDASGRFLITDVAPGTYSVRAVLIGYTEQVEEAVTVVAGETATIDFQLAAEAIALQEIVAVGYGTQTQATLTGSTAAVSGEELAAAPAMNMSTTISGKLPGVVTVNESGEPGYDGATIRIRGNHTLNNNSALVVIDGVADRAGGFSRLDARDIESISILKDASAAIYGSRAANGVILVTTKRGGSGAPQVTLNFNQGYNQPTRLPEMTNAATYMTMLNELDLSRGREPRYAPDEIQNYRDGTDPWLHPNTDWFDEVIKPMSFQTRGHLALRGGTERIGYYLSLGGLTEDGFYENSATRYNQYSFRTNLDGRVTDNLSLRFNLSGRLEDRNLPNRDANDIFRAIMRGKPNLPAYWPNGQPGPDIEFGNNPVIIGTPATGSDDDEQYYVQGTVGLDFQVPGIEGLTLRGNATYDSFFRYRKQWRTPWTLYIWDLQTRDENGDPVLEPAERGFSDPELNQSNERSTDVTLNLIAEYQRDFGAHALSLLGGVERQTSNWSDISVFRKSFLSDQIDQIFAGGDAEKDNGGSAGVLARQNYFARMNYNYRDKYLLELVGRYDGSYIFPEENRFGFFPAVSAGWRISEEPFFRNSVPLLDELKIRASWGQTGNDRIDEWQYLASFDFGGGYVFGVDREVNSLVQSRTPNPNITWEVANQFDFGIEGELLDNRLSFVFDYFDYRRNDILWWRNASVPQTSGLSLPRENIGKVASWGYDGSLTWRDQLAEDVFYEVTLNAGYSQNEILFWDEPPGAPEWQQSTGHRMDTGLYYKAIGVFVDSAAVEAYPHWEGARPGDIIYEDVNGDGEINGDDRIRIDENDDPTLTGGVTLRAQVKDFDFTVLFQGAAGAVQYVLTESGDIGNYLQEFAENRWTPDNPSGTHPRAFNRGDEYWTSEETTNQNTYWLEDTDYLRLKTLELGYHVPQHLVASTLGIEDLRVYLSGFNLLTLSKFKLFDPETRDVTGSYYPQKRVFNVGASVTF